MRFIVLLTFLWLIPQIVSGQKNDVINSTIRLSKKANKHYEKGNYKKSIALYTQAIELFPTLEFTYYHRGIVYKAMGELELAFADFDRGITFNTKSTTCYYERGLIYFETGRFEEAIDDFDTHLEINGDNEKCKFYKATALMNIAKYKLAIDIYDELITKRPSYGKYYIQRANCYVHLNQFDNVPPNLRKLDELNDSSYARYKLEAAFYIHTKNSDKAKVAANKNIKPNNTSIQNADAYHVLSNVYYFNRQLDSAIMAINESIKIKPNEAAYFYDRGTFFAENGQMTEAIADFNETIRLDSTHIEAYSNRTFYGWFPQKKYQNAIDDLTKIIELDSLNAHAYSNRSYAYYGLDQIERGFLDAHKSFELDPTNSYLYKNFALLYHAIDEDKEAKKMIITALELKYPFETDPEFLNLMELFEIPKP